MEVVEEAVASVGDTLEFAGSTHNMALMTHFTKREVRSIKTEQGTHLRTDAWVGIQHKRRLEDVTIAFEGCF